MTKWKSPTVRPWLGVESRSSSPLLAAASPMSALRDYLREFDASCPLHIVVSVERASDDRGWVERQTGESWADICRRFADVSVILAPQADNSLLGEVAGARYAYVDSEQSADASFGIMMDTGGHSVLIAGMALSRRSWQGKCLELMQFVKECRTWLGSEVVIRVSPDQKSVAQAVAEIGIFLSVGATALVSDESLESADSPTRVAFEMWRRILRACDCQKRKASMSFIALEREVAVVNVKCPHAGGWVVANCGRNRVKATVPRLMGGRDSAQLWGVNRRNALEIHGLVGVGEAVGVPGGGVEACIWEAHRAAV